MFMGFFFKKGKVLFLVMNLGENVYQRKCFVCLLGYDIEFVINILLFVYFNFFKL